MSAETNPEEKRILESIREAAGKEFPKSAKFEIERWSEDWVQGKIEIPYPSPPNSKWIRRIKIDRRTGNMLETHDTVLRPDGTEETQSFTDVVVLERYMHELEASMLKMAIAEAEKNPGGWKGNPSAN